MNRATRVTVSTFGILAGIAGIEHGIGEVLQGNKAPDGMVIESWPESEVFSIVAGEPAMTIVPSLFVTGILAIIASVAFLMWATTLIERKNSGLVLMALSILMLLVGGGFAPPILGIILGAAAHRMNTQLTSRRAHTSSSARGFLAKLWPWSFGTGLTAWLMLFPGSVIVAYLFGVDDASAAVPVVISALSLSAFGLLGLTIISGFAYDAERQTNTQETPAMGS